jgi:pyrimidine-specific ribonucleoside hydrolase
MDDDTETSPECHTLVLPEATLQRRQMTPGPTPVILDCDPGHDDALAILLALARPELDLRAITTVAGNAPLAATTRNALRVLTLLGRTEVPVAAGAAAPLRRRLEVADLVHGTSGLDGADLPEPAATARPEGALELLRTTIEASPVPVTLIPTGPLTNIALLARTYPRLLERVERICLMGGAVGEGNTTASAEFNIWVDPEAAAIVFDCGRPITMIGLDVTHEARMTGADADRLAALGTRTGRVFADLLRFFARFHLERYGWDGSPIHDAVAVAHVAIPGLVVTKPYHVDVETTSELTRGRTVVDRYGLTGRPANVAVGLAIDRARFVDLVVEAVARFP